MEYTNYLALIIHAGWVDMGHWKPEHLVFAQINLITRPHPPFWVPENASSHDTTRAPLPPVARTHLEKQFVKHWGDQ